MKSITKLALFAGMAGMCFAAGPFAPPAVGSFTLPYQASWGRATLPAGHYMFTVDWNHYTSAQETIELRQGTKIVALILTQAFVPASTSDGSSMRIVNEQVRALHIAPLGKTYYFPEKKRREMLVGSTYRSGISLIPVSAK